MHVLHKTTYANKNGAWDEMFPEEFERFLACIIFMGFVKRPTIAKYWATSTLYSGGWAKRFMSRDRYEYNTFNFEFYYIFNPLLHVTKTHVILSNLRIDKGSWSVTRYTSRLLIIMMSPMLSNMHHIQQGNLIHGLPDDMN